MLKQLIVSLTLILYQEKKRNHMHCLFVNIKASGKYRLFYKTVVETEYMNLCTYLISINLVVLFFSY